MNRARAACQIVTRVRPICKTMSTAAATQGKPIESSIIQKLTENFKPVHLEVINESYMHKVPKGSETHFKVVVVSESFGSKAALQRHRMINTTLEEEVQHKGVHALSIVAKTPDQWQETVQKVESSPNCRGGFGK